MEKYNIHFEDFVKIGGSWDFILWEYTHIGNTGDTDFTCVLTWSNNFYCFYVRVFKNDKSVITLTSPDKTGLLVSLNLELNSMFEPLRSSNFYTCLEIDSSVPAGVPTSDYNELEEAGSPSAYWDSRENFHHH